MKLLSRYHCHRVYSSGLFFLLSMALLLGAVPVQANSGLAGYDQPWELCALCHSLDGNSHMPRFPRLAGQRKGYIEKQLNDFRQGRRLNDGGQMSAIVTEIEVDEIVLVASWFASQKHPVPDDEGADHAAGRELFDNQGCNQCHTGDLSLTDSLIPLLRAQHSQYLNKQLSDFRQGNRVHRITSDSVADPVMILNDQEIDSLSEYLAATARQ